jgi:predicted transcriptional regulator
MDGETYRRLRMALGLTQKELAEKAGVTANYIAMMESGRKEVSQLQIYKIMDLIMEAAKNNDPVFEMMKKILLGKKN